MKKRMLLSSKSQTTIFIITAVLIISSIALIIYSRTSSKKSELGREYFINQGIEPSIDNIQNFIVDCLEETSLEALKIIGIQGGYYIEPEIYYNLEWAFIPYYYYQGQFLMPTNEEVERQLSLFVDDGLSFCLNEINFKTFQLEYSPPSTKSAIQKNKVTFTTDLSTTIQNEGKTTQFELAKHSIAINSSLYEILEVANYITESHKDDKNFICINCLTEIAKERNLFVDFIAFEEDSTLIMLLENSTAPEPYIFEFLNKYTINEIGNNN